jgi:phosphopantetheinyl transferase (holo-ACP synthase)
MDREWVGLDIERNERVTPEIAARVAGMEEFASAPDPAAIWCAKEAVFKSLRWSRPPTVIMEIELSWLGDSTFELRNGGKFGAKSGRGAIERRGPFTLAYFQTSAS